MIALSAACLASGLFQGFSISSSASRTPVAEAAGARTQVTGLVGVIEGIFITVALAMLVLVWNAWHPYFAVLARVDGRKGFHDVSRHPEGRFVPGLVLFRWDAPLFFANADVFREQVHRAVATAQTPVRRVVVAAEAMTDVDITAADALTAPYQELQQQGVELWFAGLKGPVKDRLHHYGTLAVIGEDIFTPTVGRAVNMYREKYPVDWKDWDEV